ncbi:hypothetical protein SAMN05216499_110163 [Actinacidiphila paucisporea]|uniref:Uncharacterized protein n=1 Tax=Actinacidiphila paucisporea TaxID=310782 RepID=A0A1M7I6M8_9ACTN|nr:hypothetical protein SAMN05216499_110163 [Actinacidiphila paucisporea]
MRKPRTVAAAFLTTALLFLPLLLALGNSTGTSDLPWT